MNAKYFSFPPNIAGTLLVGALALGSLLVGGVAQAQTSTGGNQACGGSITATVVTVGSRQSQDAYTLPWNETHCSDPNNLIELRLGSEISGSTAVDIWIGEASADCSLQDTRNPMQSNCAAVLSGAAVMNNRIVQLHTSDLTAAHINPCAHTDAQGRLFRFFVFRTAPSQDVAPANFGCTTARVDSRSPNAPSITSSTTLSGTSFGLAWNDDTAENVTNDSHRVYAETSVSSTSCACTSGSCLAAGSAAPGAGATSVVATTPSSSTSVSASTLGLAVGSSALLFASQIDYAGNESALSAGVCVTRVDSAGYCDLYEAETGKSCSGSCAAHGGVGLREAPMGTAALVLLGVLGLLGLAVTRVTARRWRKFA